MRKLRGWALLALVMGCQASHADPWLSPGDESVRHDIQLLADAGILRGPVTTWPLSWPDVARDVLGASESGLDRATGDALLRIQRLARDASARGFEGTGLEASGSAKPANVRGFARTPREEGELNLRASWLGDHVALRVSATVVADPDDGKRVRADGSYLGVNVGNFMISAGLMERWWGPGWDGSLILSTNARPIPGLTLERNYTDPFESPLLSWIGPWRASIAVGEAEGHDVPLEEVRFLAARVNFRPKPWMEVALTRTAQWCGGSRPCGWRTFRDLLTGRDNQTESGVPSEEQPGNQMAGYDLRLRSPWRRIPVAAYIQLIGEDEAGGLPAKFLGLFGAETWLSTALGSLRLRAEYADTACNFSRENPLFDCGYRNFIYPQGYSYRHRNIGHSIDNDSRMTTVAGLLSANDGDVYSLALRRVELNRDGAGMHSITSAPLSYENVELRYSRDIGIGRLSVGAGFDSESAGGGSETRGFVTWQQGY